MSFAPADRERRAGLAAAALAHVLWGFLPLYLNLLAFADVREVLAQRILWTAPWALVAAFALSGWKRAVSEIAAALRPRMLGTLAVSAFFILCNWALYFWMVMNQRILEASLAYFLAPLVAVGVGVVFFRERTSAAQGVALALAGAGVALQGVAIGAPPWMALAVCATWTTYAVIRKQAPVGAGAGLFIESLLLSPLAAATLLWLGHAAPLGFSSSPGHALLLALAGPLTALPLMLFAFSARRVSFAALGLLQFLSPTLQFATGVALGEAFTPLRAASFALIWAGLIFFAWDTLRRARS